MAGSRQDQYAIAVAIDGADTGIWDKKSGGEMDSEETKYKPGGLAGTITLGGSVTPGNLTVSRIFDLNRDLPAVKGWLNRVGRAGVTVTVQSLDVDGNAFGAPIVYTGKLKMVTPPEVDSESSDAGMVEIEVSPDGVIS